MAGHQKFNANLRRVLLCVLRERETQHTKPCWCFTAAAAIPTANLFGDTGGLVGRKLCLQKLGIKPLLQFVAVEIWRTQNTKGRICF